jgi:hypothetical protein
LWQQVDVRLTLLVDLQDDTSTDPIKRFGDPELNTVRSDAADPSTCRKTVAESKNTFST